MEWENQGQSADEDRDRDDVMYGKVMSEQQLETLRKQIAVYATICDQLIQMHKTITAQQDLAAGGRLGNIYCDSFTSQKFTSRQRWTPTATQLQNLERIFHQGSGTPSKHKIKEITSELSQHGQISETNVYNWFQNRRARSKRKQLLTNGNAEESVDDKNITNPHTFLPQTDHLYQDDYLDVLSNQNEPLSGKMGAPESYNLYDQADDYGMAG